MSPRRRSFLDLNSIALFVSKSDSAHFYLLDTFFIFDNLDVDEI